MWRNYNYEMVWPILLSSRTRAHIYMMYFRVSSCFWSNCPKHYFLNSSLIWWILSSPTSDFSYYGVSRKSVCSCSYSFFIIIAYSNFFLTSKNTALQLWNKLYFPLWYSMTKLLNNFAKSNSITEHCRIELFIISSCYYL